MPRSPDDRDVRKPLTPRPSVRAQTAQPESFEDETPVYGDPVQQINARARMAAHASRDAAATSKAAFAKIDDIRREVQRYVERDMADHDRLFKKYDRLDEKIETQNLKTDRINAIVGDIREEVGKMSGQLGALTSVLEAERATRMEQAKAHIEVEKQAKLTEIEVNKKKTLAQVENEQATAEFRRQSRLKMLGWIGSISAVLGTIATALTQC